VGDDEVGALRAQVSRGERAHLAGAEEEASLVGELAEDLAGELDGDVGERYGVLSDAGLIAHALGDGEGLSQAAVEVLADGVDGAGLAVALLELAEDLGLTDDHGVEAGGDAEDVSHGVEV